MGWYGIPSYDCCKNRRGGINRKRTIDREMNRTPYEVVRSTMRGTTWYGITRDTRTGKVFGEVVLTHVVDGELMCKDLDESMGPVHHAMPISYLDYLDANAPIDFSAPGGMWAADWRASCRRYQEDRAAERRERAAWRKQIREIRRALRENG